MIIPIFVPHSGCPNDCAFCNQRTISGKTAPPSLEETEKIIEKHLLSMGGKAGQIAFFGGSFTGIREDIQNEYLSLAQKYIKNGLVKSIRLSTRPDYIKKDTVKRLMSYGVTNIELGAQSMDDEVLYLSKRGHKASDVENASEIILESGCTLGLQMMTGLLGDSREKCIYTAKRFKELGAKETRIYPTVVLRGTYLEKLYNEGKYIAQTVEEAVDICAELYSFFCENSIKILRIGLADSAELKENYVAGAYHPSIGELVVSRDVRNKIEKSAAGKTVKVIANPRYISKIIGNRKCNILYFKEKGITLSVTEDTNIKDFKVVF